MFRCAPVLIPMGSHVWEFTTPVTTNRILWLLLDTSRKATTYGKLLEPLGLYEDDKYRIDCLSLISCRRGNALAWEAMELCLILVSSRNTLLFMMITFCKQIHWDIDHCAFHAVIVVQSGSACLHSVKHITLWQMIDKRVLCR